MGRKKSASRKPPPRDLVGRQIQKTFFVDQEDGTQREKVFIGSVDEYCPISQIFRVFYAEDNDTETMTRTQLDTFLVPLRQEAASTNNSTAAATDSQRVQVDSLGLMTDDTGPPVVTPLSGRGTRSPSSKATKKRKTFPDDEEGWGPDGEEGLTTVRGRGDDVMDLSDQDSSIDWIARSNTAPNWNSDSDDDDDDEETGQERHQEKPGDHDNSKSSGTSGWGDQKAPNFGWGRGPGNEAPVGGLEANPQERTCTDAASGWGSIGVGVNASGWGSSQASTAGWGDHESSSRGRGAHRVPTRKLRRVMKPCKYLTACDDPVEVVRDATDQFILHKLFPGRLKIVETKASSCASLEPIRDFRGGSTGVLVATKYEKKDSRGTYFAQTKFAGPYFKAFYVLPKASSKHYSESKLIQSVQTELDRIANFSALTLHPGKCTSRLELLVSTARTFKFQGRQHPYMYFIPSKKVQVIEDLPESHSMGCGYIGSEFLLELLGGNERAAKISCVQVRIVSPDDGLFKGMLVVKPGIETIQLNPSMRKVGPSLSSKKFSKNPLLLINGVFPSQANENFGRALNPGLGKVPTKSASAELKRLPYMICKLLAGCGVPDELLLDADGFSQDFATRWFAYLKGVCDCTAGKSLPEGAIFITGIEASKLPSRDRGDEYDHEVCITRTPCTETNDAILVPVVTRKPVSMTQEDWDYLCSLSFGAVVFGSPRNSNSPSLPELINSSDLDGDNFCTLWHHEVHVHLVGRLRDYSTAKMEFMEAKNASDLEAKDKDTSSIDLDPLIGTQLPVMLENKFHQGTIREKTKEGLYVIDCGEVSLTWTREDITDSRDFLDKIVGHRNVASGNKKAEVKVKWNSGRLTWEKFWSIKGQDEASLAQYALDNDLLDESGWRWARELIYDAEIIEIRSHRRREGQLMVEVKYEDGDTRWIAAKEVDDLQVLAAYVEKKDISLHSKDWRWLQQEIDEAKKGWLPLIQERLCNAEHIHRVSQFIEKLHSAHKKRRDVNDCNSIAFGRAYKQALDIIKHGGRVALPAHLHKEVGANGAKYASHLVCDAPLPKSPQGYCNRSLESGYLPAT